jgi:sugar phosphate isomerase/epimerase
MDIACQERLLPGDSFREKVECAARIGFEGIEINASFDASGGSSLAARLDEIRDAIADKNVSISSICGGHPNDFLAVDSEKRRQAVECYEESLRLAGELGTTGPILVPIFGAPQISDPWPLRSLESLEKEILAAICEQLAAVAVEHDTNVLLEPLNRYETHLINTLADAVEVCEMAGSPNGLTIMADFFHMNIEEANIAESIRKAGDWISHVHLADSTRLEPGTAHTDFGSGLGALQDIGYEGYMALECGLSGAPEESLTSCVEYLKEIRATL